jgi:hypothetical protein
MRPPLPSCRYEWTSAGTDKLHTCMTRGEHSVHECGDDGCAAASPVSARGGRKRQDHGHAGRR